MSNITHTPGPWSIASDGQTIVAPNDWIAICQKRTECTRANAQLIAAAPTMLEFIKTVALGNTEYDRLQELAQELIKVVQS